MCLVAEDEFKDKTKLLEFINEEFEGNEVTHMFCKECKSALLSYARMRDGQEMIIEKECEHFTWFFLPYFCDENLERNEKGRLRCTKCVIDGNTELCNKILSVSVFSMKTKYCTLLLLDKDKLKELK